MTEEFDNKMRREIHRRRTYRHRSIFVCAFMLAAATFFMGGASNAGRADRMYFKKSDRRSNDTQRFRTDGNITFTVPKGFWCTDSVIGKTKVFFLEDSHERSVTINSMNVVDSPESINSLYKDLCDGEMDEGTSTILADTTFSDKSCTKYIKVRKYTGNGFVVFWRFALLFDKATGKACLVSAYDQGNGDYLELLLESVRFSH